jgi:hypothetical protein
MIFTVWIGVAVVVELSVELGVELLVELRVEVSVELSSDSGAARVVSSAELREGERQTTRKARLNSPTICVRRKGAIRMIRRHERPIDVCSCYRSNTNL